MADINIERKRPSLWLWVVGVAVLVAVVYLAAQFFGDREAPNTDPQTQSPQN